MMVLMQLMDISQNQVFREFKISNIISFIELLFAVAEFKDTYITCKSLGLEIDGKNIGSRQFTLKGINHHCVFLIEQCYVAQPKLKHCLIRKFEMFDKQFFTISPRPLY